jgi:hypothetical protein
MTKWRDKIEIHPACNLIPPMSAEELKSIGKDIKTNGLKQPIVFWRDEETKKESLLDGRSRLDAMEAEGLPIFAGGALVVPHVIRTLNPKGKHDVKRPESETPESYVWSANVHRRHLDGKQKREAIANAIKAHPEKSSRAIARMVGVSHNTVESVRTEMEDVGKLPTSPTRTDTQGRQQPAHKEGKPSRKRPSRSTLLRESREARLAAASKPAEPDVGKPEASRVVSDSLRAHEEQATEPEKTADDRRALYAAAEANAPLGREQAGESKPALMFEWLISSDEQKSEFVNSVGLVKLYELASEAQRKQLEAHFPTARWKKANGLDGVATTIDGTPVKELPPPEPPKTCAQCKDTIQPPDVVVASDGQPLHSWCEPFWHRDHGGVHYGESAVPPTVPTESTSNALDSLNCAAVPGGVR